MKIAVRDGDIILQQLTPDQYNIIKSWNLMRWIRAEQALRGKASIDLLDKLATLGKLPPRIEAQRQELHRVQNAVDRERLNPHTVPLINPPVKAELFEHQKRALNMSLITFGWVSPEEETTP